ncbi:hypothetical protein QOZ80_5BG0439830 [Eleusine coracana subsp. coracana]|nr:hypothetical protein QOZ80_5BG0439830 [Eleusine coracana subsp. coracana]
MDKLTDDLLIEIFSHVPYKSLCCFACVSRRWHTFISHPDHCWKLSQTLAGFFYNVQAPEHNFPDVSGASPPFFDPSFAFLPDRERECIHLVDGCNGLLFRCFKFADDPHEFDYLVINPATEKWVALPVSRRWLNQVGVARLGFDPAVSSHFYVFEFQLDWAETEDEDGDSHENDDKDGYVLGVVIYSSQNRAWTHKQSGWSSEIVVTDDFKSIFVNGMLYVVASMLAVRVVDVEGNNWRIIDFPGSEEYSFFLDAAAGYIDMSQGQLLLLPVIILSVTN